VYKARDTPTTYYATGNRRSMTTFYYYSVNHQSGLW
jgi:hypothetical protein